MKPKNSRRFIRDQVDEAFQYAISNLWRTVQKEVIEDLKFSVAFPRKNELILDVQDEDYDTAIEINISKAILERAEDFDMPEMFDDFTKALDALSGKLKAIAKKRFKIVPS